MIRNARMEDVKATYALLLHFSEKGLLLGRSLSSIYDHLRDFQVFVEPESHKIIGVCALHIVWENLAEIRSLAVSDEARVQGIGTALVTSCLAEADRLGISDVFTLTYQPAFFERLGFHPIDKKELPHKVWSDCLNCPKFPDCNEDALMWHKETL